MNQGVFGALTIAFDSAAQKKAWLAAPLDTGRAPLREAGIEPEDSDLFGTQITVKAKSLKAALEALTDMGFEIAKRDVESWEKVVHEGAPGIRVQTKGELSAKTDAKAWLARLKKVAAAGDGFFGVEDGAKRVRVLAYFEGYDAFTHEDEGFSLAFATASALGAVATLGMVGDAGMLDEAVYRGLRRVDGKLVATRFDEPQDLTEALYTALVRDHGVDTDAIEAGRAAWLDTHAEKKVLLERGGKAALVRPDGTFLVEPRYTAMGGPVEGRISFRDASHRWGYLDERGEVVVPPAFFTAHDFREGLARVRVETERVQLSEHSAQVQWKYGFIDRSGTFVIPAMHDQVEDFAGGRAMTKVDGKLGYLDPQGQLAIAATYDFAMPFSDGFALVCVGDRYAGGRWGFIDAHGEALVEPSLRSAGAFYQGFAPIQDDTGKWGILDTGGRVVVTPRYPDAAFVQDGRVIARDATGYGVFDAEGNVVLAPTWKRVTARGPVFEVMREDTRRELYSRDGVRLGTLDVLETGDFGDGRIAARTEAGGLWGYLSTAGEWAIAPAYKQAFVFGGERAVVVDDAGVAVIDAAGQVVGRPTVSPISDASAFGRCGFAALAHYYGKQALVNRSGELTIPFHLSATYLKHPEVAWVEYKKPE